MLYIYYFKLHFVKIGQHFFIQFKSLVLLNHIWSLDMLIFCAAKLLASDLCFHVFMRLDNQQTNKINKCNCWKHVI